MIFCARQMIEKTLEYEEAVYISFADLKKAVYHLRPRGKPWKGIDVHLVRLIKSFDDGM